MDSTNSENMDSTTFENSSESSPKCREHEEVNVILDADALPDLLNIPQEVLLHIFSFLEAEFLLTVVANVCLDLRNLLLDEGYWKIRFFRQFPKPYPIIQEPDFSWIDACKDRETCKRIWRSSDLKSNTITLNKICGSAIDAVNLPKKNFLCLSGGRDRSISMWKLRNYPESNYESCHDPRTEFEKLDLVQHKGWVWSISSYDDEFCSTSFDCTVKFWDVNEASENHGMKLSVKTESAVLCSTYMFRDVVAVGCFNKKVLVIDERSGEIVKELLFHKRAVLCVDSNDNTMVSSGEDGCLNILDKRTWGCMQAINCDSFYMSMDLHEKQMWTGSRDGSITAYDINDLTNAKPVLKFEYGFKGKITGLRYTHGAVYSCSTDGAVKIYEPTSDPLLIADTQYSGAGGVADLSVRNNTLAVSTSGGLVALWNP